MVSLKELANAVKNKGLCEVEHCNQTADYICHSYCGILICKTCKTMRYFDCKVSEYKHPKPLSELVYHVSSMITQISYDSEELRIGNTIEDYDKDMEVFMDKADDLNDRTCDCITRYINGACDRRQLGVPYKEAETLKTDLINSQMFESCMKYIAMKKINDRLFHPAERIISVRDRNLAPRLRDISLEIEKAMEEQKNEEVKQLEDQYVGTIEALELKVAELMQSIDETNNQCINRAQQVLDTIKNQRKIISVAGDEDVKMNEANQEALKSLLEHDQQQDQDELKLVDKVEVVFKSFTDHLGSYSKVTKKFKGDNVQCRKNIDTLEKTVTLKNNDINQLKNEVQNCKTENSNLNNQLSQSTKEIESLNVKKKKYKKEKKEKDKEIDKLSNDVETRDAQVRDLKQQIDTLKVEGNTKTDVITGLEKQVQKEKNMTEELRVQNEDMAAEIEGHKKKQNMKYGVE